ncbi:NAD(P)/FAD-dependent oxidoreductase [Planococcus sp. ISL-110]|uniref:NAD(P)/FAD-dependent oxidoreductase n=1 Tax=Planococcus sp. ISL-110 TaxID=2819167 RepID=UPI001BE72AB6|nr:NAD(P)/FAD-dependent oxidoreductase [Planococcus sp. ISL-110]MBT2571509.1 NAD(P)-binding domain-containing protein [Planococcus sp. ISL-110]
MITIIGAGPAGIGMGVLLRQSGVEDFVIIEKDTVGSTFFQWPKETKLITPSFTAHGFGQLDLNAILPDTSPAYTFGKEHLSGEEYGDYLDLIAGHYDLPVREHTMVHHIEKRGERYWIQTDEEGDGHLSDSIIVACGEFQFPKRPFSAGLHYRDVVSWGELEGPRMVIGGGESSADAAFHLASKGEQVDVYYSADSWFDTAVDPSRTLSPFTRERISSPAIAGKITQHSQKKAVSVEQDADLLGYTVTFEDGTSITTENEPIICTGFSHGAKQFGELFEWNEEGLPLLTDKDESTIAPSVFLIGPSVRQAKTIFCFIYKFRQRFAIVAEELFDRHQLAHNPAVFNSYKAASMYLSDLSCCENECAC